MAEIVNLNRFAKRRRREEAVAQADANRAKFGRTRAEREADAAERARRDALLDGARRDD